MSARPLLFLLLIAAAFVPSLAAAQPQAGRGDAAYESAPAAPAVFAASGSGSAGPATPASALRIGSTFVVTTVADTGAGSLRAAITSANALAGLDQVSFALPGSGVQRITLLTALPTITSPIVLDATTQPGWVGSPLVEVTWGGAGTGANGFVINAGSSVVRGFILNGFPTNGATTGYALWLDVLGGNVVEGNWFGLDATGLAARPNRNVAITIRGNSGFNRIGGFTALARNVIAGNATTALSITNVGVGHNRIAGNWFGLNATGTAVVPNGGNNLFVAAPDDTIGGLEAGARNVITASGSGFPDVFLAATAPRTIVRGNYIGVFPNGLVEAASPSNGINVRSADNVIGDSTAAGRNVIGGTDRAAIYVFGTSALRNRILGNYLGTDATGTVALGDWNGITLDTSNDNVIGGVTPGAANVVGGHPGPGIALVSGSTGNRILGNRIGTDASGAIPLPNRSGVRIENCAGNRIGGAAAGEGNQISGNDGFGIELYGVTTTGTRISGNRVGTTANGRAALPNGGGIFVFAATDTIGGTAPAEENRIAFNSGPGILDSLGSGILIARNSIASNVGLGIDLFPAGITANDSLDGDTGSNGRQNFPTIDSVVVAPGVHWIHGHLDAAPNTVYTARVYYGATYHPSHFGEGDTLIDSGIMGTDSTGRGYFSFDVPPFRSPVYLAATVSDPAGNTSEFSQAFSSADTDGDGLPDSWETQGWGLDVNSDGVVDLDLYARGARPDHKDLFAELDAMSGLAPPQQALDDVSAAFAVASPDSTRNPDGDFGISLHAALDDVAIPVQRFPNIWTDFALVKKQWFGTQAERTAPNSRYILEAKHLVYRYGLWAHSFGVGRDTSWSGVAEDNFNAACDDFMVTFGVWTPATRTNVDVQAGTFMHEFGHSLGLHHGGADDSNDKPNYMSVMNYLWQMPSNWNTPGSWQLDYSNIAMAPLVETALSEPGGFAKVDPARSGLAIPFRDSTAHVNWAWLVAGQPIDWSGDSLAANPSVTADVNHISDSPRVPSPGETLAGQADWPRLKFNFRNSAAFRTDPSLPPILVKRPASPAVPEEMSRERYEQLQALPLPQPEGHFRMDGRLDAGARLLTTHSGVHLWADVWRGQLYVATDSAAGRDVRILVADERGALAPAPAGHAGSVGAYDATLAQASSAPRGRWTDPLAHSLNAIAVDSAGAVLEGVVDLRYLFRRPVTSVFLAVARYDTITGGALLEQAPAGNGNGNVEGAEYVEWLMTAGVTAGPRTPERLALSGARPNPTSAGAMFTLAMPRAGLADVRVLDVAGRAVAVLADGRLEAGAHTFRWDGAEAHALPGVYFVVARALGETRVTRVVVLR